MFDFLDSNLPTLSLDTLLAVLVIPLLYFGYRRRYWYRGDLIYRANFIFTLIVSLVAVIVLAAAVRLREVYDFQDLKLLAAHLATIIISLIIFARERLLLRGGRHETPNPAAEQNNQAGGYVPTPVNLEIEDIGWNDIVINEEVKQELISVIDLLKDPKTAERYGIQTPKGILFNGPPGTGKTTVAKVVANTARMAFFVLKLDEVVSKWVGESEKNLSRLFKAAQKHAPAIIFIDEVDSIGKQRSGSSTNAWSESLLNHLLQLVDGVIKTNGLYIIAATNRADLVDSALKRAGRLNKVIEIPLPDHLARIKLFYLYLSKLKLSVQLNLDFLATSTEGYSCADIKEICNQIGLNAFKRESLVGKRNYMVTLEDVEQALYEWMNREK